MRTTSSMRIRDARGPAALPRDRVEDWCIQNQGADVRALYGHGFGGSDDLGLDLVRLETVAAAGFRTADVSCV